MRKVMCRDDHQSARLTIESMHDAGANQSRQRSLSIKIELQPVRQRSFLQVACWMRDNTGRLVDDEHPWIFIHQAEGNRLRRVQLVGRFDEPHADTFSGEHTARRRGRGMIDLDVAGGGQSLHPPGRVIAQMFDQKAVNAHAVQFRFND